MKENVSGCFFLNTVYICRLLRYAVFTSFDNHATHLATFITFY